MSEQNPEALVIDGADAALVAIGARCGMEPVAIYDRAKLVWVFIRQGMTPEEADEWVSFNIEGAYLGPGTPIIACF